MVFETLSDINQRLGITVIVIEQKVALLSSHCNRVIVMDHGRIALEGTPHEVFCHSHTLRTIGRRQPAHGAHLKQHRRGRAWRGGGAVPHGR